MKCPKCDRELKKDDIECEIRFSTASQFRDHIYVCKKCGYIIGFGASNVKL
jgi:RNase P subunit RPR2